MSDGGFHEAQVNNMEMVPVSMIVKRTLWCVMKLKLRDVGLLEFNRKVKLIGHGDVFI